MVGTFFIQYIFVVIFNNKYYHSTDLYSVINTLEYQNKLNNYINNNTLVIMFIILIIFLPIFLILFNKYKSNTKLYLNKVILCIILGISLSLTFNIYLNLINIYNISKLPIYVQIISSGIIGPILEELLFRGIIYNKLKEFNNTTKAMIISTIIFSLFHSTLVDIIYALFIGYLLVYIYEKYKSIKYPIIIHISANISVILISLILSLNLFILNIILFILCIIVLLIIIYKKMI